MARNDTGDTGIKRSERAELLRLRTENEELRLERAILRRASFSFAQE
jgi:transposase-like protein